MKKTVLSVLLALVLVLSLTVTAFAAVIDDNVAHPNYTYIGGTRSTFEVNTFSCICYGSVECKANVVKAKVKLQLQKDVDGVWTTVETWEETVNGASCALEETASISPFSTYRLKATFTAYTSTDSESTTRYAYE